MHIACARVFARASAAHLCIAFRVIVGFVSRSVWLDIDCFYVGGTEPCDCEAHLEYGYFMLSSTYFKVSDFSGPSKVFEEIKSGYY